MFVSVFAPRLRLPKPRMTPELTKLVEDVIAPPSRRRVPALFQLLPLNSKVLPVAAAMAVPEKVPPVPMKMSADCVPVRLIPVPMLSVLLPCQAVKLL